MPGVHNVLNATAAIAVGIGLEINVGTDSRRARKLSRRGPSLPIARQRRRRERDRRLRSPPTEIRATLAAARQCGFRKIHVVFQPHRYTRTQLLMDEFANAFDEADTLFILDIYAASEQPIEGMTGEALARHIQEEGEQEARYAALLPKPRKQWSPQRRGRHDPDAGRRQRLATRPDDSRRSFKLKTTTAREIAGRHPSNRQSILPKKYVP